MEFWHRLREHLEGGEPAFLCLVGDNTDHSPGTRGAKIFVRPDGSTEGTIGGGVMEGELIAHGVELLAGGAEVAPYYQTLYHRRKGPGKKSGLGCAGEQSNVYAVVQPGRDLEVVREIARRIAADEAGLLRIDAAGLTLGESGVIDRNTAPVRLTVDDDAWRFEAQLLNWKRAAIFGGGHCALALSRVLNNLGYTVSVFDTRAEVFTFVGNDHARHRVTVADFKDAGAHLKYPELTHAIVMTREQPADVRALIGLIERPLPYIGVMGSPAKLAMIRRDLIHAGFDKSVLDAENIYAPIGLPMTSNTPEEIAISIAGELLAERGALFPMA
ncbi:XdhC family protein [Bradymonas sediminis]|uniref:Uncharacterized protein n=1 Tax=Bradymonas sediminis TaxID=1548548 RepID=A0A2Z4FGF0_9DELT|nr:XdhC/CoxI family protein [Bradymonas sediminis]AWV88041.1 hypothetical protein DN745_01310 [Bradymonas sediminis]TDP77164.1 xanthine dehydrogenase accessory factor [Bradymonas sediminis]